MNQTIRSEKAEYEVNPTLWTNKGDRLTTVGDFLGRLPSIELLIPTTGDVVLDAGCGAGFCSRRIARLGAKVFGCDRAEKMINQAIKHEKEQPLGISYCSADITTLPYANEMFDAVVCIAVLIHDSPKECSAFFAEALRVLKPGGRIIVSIMHSALYQADSPNRTGESSWAQYKPLEEKPMSESQRFEELYRDSLGNTFTSTVWYHPENLLTKLLNKAGFIVLHDQKKFVTNDILNACNQSGKVGYPAFQQVMAIK